jgi:hypothetical protein
MAQTSINPKKNAILVANGFSPIFATLKKNIKYANRL